MYIYIYIFIILIETKVRAIIPSSCCFFPPSYKDGFDVWPAKPGFKGAIGLETDHDAIPWTTETPGKCWKKHRKTAGEIEGNCWKMILMYPDVSVILLFGI